METRAPVASGLSLGKLFRRQPRQMAQASLPEWHLQGHLLILRAWPGLQALGGSAQRLALSCPALSYQVHKDTQDTLKHKQVKACRLPISGLCWAWWAGHCIEESKHMPHPIWDRTRGLPSQLHLVV